MKEKFRLRCDLNAITDIADMDQVAESIETFQHIAPHHRYSYLFSGYHDLTHGKIDEETFFTLGDISSTTPLFSSASQAGLETLFAIEQALADNTLYLVEQSARTYYLGKVGHDRSGAFRNDVTNHGSNILIV